jgi:hypothetical protein
MPLNWTTTGKQSLAHGIKCLVHGLAGTGKTRLIPTLPQPVAIGSAESGTLSIAGNNLPMTEIKSLADLQDFYFWAASSAESRPFISLALDSVSEIAERILGIEKAGTKDPRKAYGEMQDKVAANLRLFRDLPGKHVYFSSKTQLREMPDGTHMYHPLMPGKLMSEQLPFFFDEVFYLGVSEYEKPPARPGDAPTKVSYSFLQTKRTSIIEAKDRSGALAEVEEPDLSKIFAKITQRLTASAS